MNLPVSTATPHRPLATTWRDPCDKSVRSAHLLIHRMYAMHTVSAQATYTMQYLLIVESNHDLNEINGSIDPD